MRCCSPWPTLVHAQHVSQNIERESLSKTVVLLDIAFTIICRLQSHCCASVTVFDLPPFYLFIVCTPAKPMNNFPDHLHGTYLYFTIVYSLICCQNLYTCSFQKNEEVPFANHYNTKIRVGIMPDFLKTLVVIFSS